MDRLFNYPCKCFSFPNLLAPISVSITSQPAGSAFLLKTADGEHLWLGGNCCKASSPLMAETITLLEGLKAIQELHLPSIEINTDSVEVVNIATGITPVPSSLQKLFILSLFHSLHVICVIRILRSSNFASHSSAHYGRS